MPTDEPNEPDLDALRALCERSGFNLIIIPEGLTEPYTETITRRNPDGTISRYQCTVLPNEPPKDTPEATP